MLGVSGAGKLVKVAVIRLARMRVTIKIKISFLSFSFFICAKKVSVVRGQ